MTKLVGPVPWSYGSLSVILDILSRYVVGWMVAHRESAALAEKLIKETCSKQTINKCQLTIPADRGASMRSKPGAVLLSDLGGTQTPSRPDTSDDNPFSESQCKTLQYRPDFPGRLGCMEDSRSFCQNFFPWYNTEHRHSGLGVLTPEVVHDGLAEQTQNARGQVLSAVYEAHPERFVRKHPVPPSVPVAVWITTPKRAPVSEGKVHSIQTRGGSKSLTRSAIGKLDKVSIQVILIGFFSAERIGPGSKPILEVIRERSRLAFRVRYSQ